MRPRRRKAKNTRAFDVHPDGTLIGIIPVPADGPTNCCFGSDDMQALFITAKGIR